MNVVCVYVMAITDKSFKQLQDNPYCVSACQSCHLFFADHKMETPLFVKGKWMTLTTGDKFVLAISYYN